MSVCVCVRVCACVHACMRVCVCVRVRARARARACVCVHIHIYVVILRFVTTFCSMSAESVTLGKTSTEITRSKFSSLPRYSFIIHYSFISKTKKAVDLDCSFSRLLLHIFG